MNPAAASSASPSIPAPPPPATAVGRRYELLRLLGHGGMGAVYAALDRLTGQQVALKRILIPAPGDVGAAPDPLAATLPPESAAQTRLLAPSRGGLAETTRPASPLAPAAPATEPGAGLLRETLVQRLAIAQEFRTLASLRHPHIISVLDYGFSDDAQPFFTMELLRDAQPLLAAQALELHARVDHVGQILQALVYLHRRGVLHRDLKPANVLCVRGDGRTRVKVLDFGLAVTNEQVARSREEIAGTLPYLAPEILLGTGASVASDLYAVGVMLFELLTGQHPLPPARTAADAVSVLLHAAPRLALLDAHPPLRPVVERLLARAPHERYTDAEQALRALMQACNLPLPAESAEVRESFLHAADFVGRDAEWARLRAVLDRVMDQGSGAAWLVAGESGVGKSRLVDELRTYALVQGALVVRGQSVSAGGSAYQAWQELLRPLCLYVPLTELERSVMASLVPDVGALQRCSVEPPPPLEPQAAQARLFAVVVSVLRRTPRPLLLILEDLHWAAPESMALLQRLLAALPDRPLLVLATYRDDEAPTLAAQLQATHLLKLQRITAPEIARLTRSMLGPAGARPELVDLLERETEGNLSSTQLCAIGGGVVTGAGWGVGSW